MYLTVTGSRDSNLYKYSQSSKVDQILVCVDYLLFLYIRSGARKPDRRIYRAIYIFIYIVHDTRVQGCHNIVMTQMRLSSDKCENNT